MLNTSLTCTVFYLCQTGPCVNYLTLLLYGRKVADQTQDYSWLTILCLSQTSTELVSADTSRCPPAESPWPALLCQAAVVVCYAYGVMKTGSSAPRFWPPTAEQPLL